jgi:hypothetical protein
MDSEEGPIVNSASPSAPAGHLPVPSTATHPVDPYSDIERLPRSGRARASLLGLFAATVLVAVAVGAALLFTAAIFGYPGGGS